MSAEPAIEERRAGRGPQPLRRRPPLLRACEAPGVAGEGRAVGRAAADPRGEGLAAAAGAPARRVALRRHAAAPGRRARVRDGGAAPERRARSRGEALLLDDGAGRVAPHRGVAEADRADRRRGGARPASRQARPHVPRGGHARGEGLPDAGLLRAADHPALPADRALVARDDPRGHLQPARDRRRHPPRRRAWRTSACCSRARTTKVEEHADRRREPDAARVRRARALAPEGARDDRQPDGGARPRAAQDRAEPRRAARARALGLDVADVALPF